MKTFPLEQAIRAQTALRQAAGMGPECFPVEAFVGMISDEVEKLRSNGQTDEQIVAIIQQNSGIEISAAEIAQYYATPEERHPPHP